MAQQASSAETTAPVGRSDFASMKRILIKMGTSVVTHLDGTVALGRVAHLVEQIVDLHVRIPDQFHDPSVKRGISYWFHHGRIGSNTSGGGKDDGIFLGVAASQFLPFSSIYSPWFQFWTDPSRSVCNGLQISRYNWASGAQGKRAMCAVCLFCG